MEITILGYFLLPLGILTLVFKPEYIFYFFVFFTPFSASAVINIEKISFGLQPGYWFGILWLSYMVIKLFLKGGKISVTNIQKKFIILLIIFWISALLSLLMPFIWEYKVYVCYPEGIFDLLEFKRIHITQFLYLTFITLVTLFVTIEINNKKKLIKTMQVFLYSTLFVLYWGVFQFICSITNIEYPAWLFNNNISFSQQWGQKIFIMKRINSVLPEPSMFAFFVLQTIPIVLTLCFYKVYLIRRYLLNILIIGLFIIVILSTSTTAYIGVLFILSIMFFYFVILKNIPYLKTFKINIISFYFIKIIFLILFSICVALIFIIFFYNISLINLIEILKIITINKITTHSGTTRLEGFVRGIEIFLKNPVLGVGWGSNRTFDLATTLLSNVGIIGFIAFLSVVYKSLQIAINVHKKTRDLFVYSISIGLFFSIISSLFIFFISIPDIIFIFFWVIIGCAVSLDKINVINNNKK